MKRTEIAKTVRILAEPVEKLLNDVPALRLHYFVVLKRNNASDFEVSFAADTLCFSTDKVTPEEIKTYEKIFRTYSGAKCLDSAGQSERWEKVVNRFGEDGGLALNDMFMYVNELENRARRARGQESARGTKK